MAGDDWTRVGAAPGVEVWRGPERGRPLVTAHGIEDSWRSWRALAPHLPGYTVYALDLPWRGGNDYTWRAQGGPARWLRRALELVPADSVAILGHSFGANAILEHLASPDPSPDPNPGTGGAPAIKAAALFAPFYRPLSFDESPQLRRRSLAAFRRVIVEGLRLKLGGRADRLDPDLLGAMTAKLLDRVVPAAFPVFYDEFLASGRLDLSATRVPVLVLAGAADEGLTPARARALDLAMPSAAVRLRAGYGHFCHITEAASSGREAHAFLAGRPAGSPEPNGGTSAMSVLLDSEPTSYVGTPRYEGANIRTWIGFKHFMYLVEEAILQYFRDRGVGVRALYQRYGLGLEIIDSSVQLPTALELDDQVHATVVAAPRRSGAGAAFDVDLTVERDTGLTTALKGKVRVALIRLPDGGPDEVPPMLQPYVTPDVTALVGDQAESLPIEDGQTVEEVLAPASTGAFLWSWRAPYFYSHFSDRLQHSAYVRTMEEVVDRFLHDRGLAIGHLLVERGWIPVVSRARVRMLGEVWIEETVHTVFSVQDILRDTMYTARMDCYVRRGDRLVHTATGTIMHGYAISRGPQAGTVATLDPRTQAALLGRVLERAS